MRQHMYKGIHCTTAAEDGKQLRVHQEGLGSMSYSLSTMEQSSGKKKNLKEVGEDEEDVLIWKNL